MSILGLLTIVYCPGDNNLLNSKGYPVHLGEDEVGIFAGAALEEATKLHTPTGRKSIYQSTKHSIAHVAECRTSLVFRQRGHSKALLYPPRFLTDGASNFVPLKISEFYERFERTHRSVNESVTTSSCA